MSTWPQAVSSWGEAEYAAARAVLDSGRLTIGDKVAEFEAAFARHVGRRHAVMVNSGSSANLIAVAALYHCGEFRRGDEAIVPALAWATTYAPLWQYGLKLRVVDVDPCTLNVDPSQLDRALNYRTRLLVGVSLLGNGAPLPEMRDFASRHGLAFMEDNCESLGATVDGRHTGTFGDVGTYSFFFSHHLNTVEGGMVVTDNGDLADLARSLRAHGWTRDVAADSPLRDGSGSGFPAAYDFVVPGYNVRPTEIAAAVGLVQLQRLPEMEFLRCRNADAFADAFADDLRFLPRRYTPGAVPFALTLVAHRGRMRPAMLEKLAAAGIDCRLIAGGCFTRQRSAKCYEFEAVDELPNACLAHDNGFMLGNHAADLRRHIGRLKEALAA